MIFPKKTKVKQAFEKNRLFNLVLMLMESSINSNNNTIIKSNIIENDVTRKTSRDELHEETIRSMPYWHHDTNDIIISKVIIIKNTHYSL